MGLVRLMLPNFLVIGAMKGGTTSLYRYLREHPQIFMPSVKEPMFFSSNWKRGLEWYERLFDGADTDTVAVGEASANYTKYPHIPGVPAHIAKVLPEVRLLYLIRHPVDRMISEYHHRIAKGWDHGEGSLEKALLANESYCDFSRYAMQIDQYLEYFHPNQLLVLKSEDLKTERMQTLRRVYEFLGVDSSWQPPHLWQEFHTSSEQRPRRPVDKALRKIPGYRTLASIALPSLKRLKYRLTTRKAPPKPALSDGARRELEDRLREDLRRLRQHVGEDFDGWGID
jgi:Sulfotransferase domain